jgi:hypothetical protein
LNSLSSFLLSFLSSTPVFEKLFSPRVPVLDASQANLLWRVSFLSLGSSFYAWYRGYDDLVMVPGGVFLTSILYWSYPDYSWRRTLDISYVCTALCYQLYKVFSASFCEHKLAFLLFLGMGITSYVMGIVFYMQEKYWWSTYAHALLHVFANTSNLILYSGNIKSIKNIKNIMTGMPGMPGRPVNPSIEISTIQGTTTEGLM